MMNKPTTMIGSLFGKLVLGSSKSTACGGRIHRTVRDFRIGSAQGIRRRCNEEPGSGPGHVHRVKNPKRPKRRTPFHSWTTWLRSPYAMDHPKNLAPATFAVEKYNNVKNAKLQLVRVNRVIEELCDGTLTQRIKLDAVDEQGVIKHYDAIVLSRSDRPDMMLEFFMDDQAKNPDGSEIYLPYFTWRC